MSSVRIAVGSLWMAMNMSDRIVWFIVFLVVMGLLIMFDAGSES